MNAFIRGKVVTRSRSGPWLRCAVALVLLSALLSCSSPWQPPMPGLLQTSWIGNTFPGGGPAECGDDQPLVPTTVGGAYVLSDGSLVTNSYWEEAGREVTVFNSSGDVVTSGCDTHEQGGTAITSDGSYLYQGMATADSSVNAVRRMVMATGASAPYPGGSSPYGYVPVSSGVDRRIVGMGITGNDLYVAMKDGVVGVFDKRTMQQLRRFSVDAGIGAIATDAAGGLFAIHDESYVVKYDAQGTKLATLTAVGRPSAIAVENSGARRLMVFDDGPDQQVKYFSTSDLAQAGKAFGQRHGLTAQPNPGEPLPTRLEGLIGLGTDRNGDMYVVMNIVAGGQYRDETGDSYGGAIVIRSFSPEGRLRWERLALAHVDSVVVDPTDPNVVYTARDRFRFDLSKPIGRQFTWAAHTIDRFRYPDDPRLTQTPAYPASIPIAVRDIGGHKFLVVTSMGEGPVDVFRFDGNIAVPTGSIPVDGRAVVVDDKGNLWTAGQQGPIRRRDLLGFDAAGAPRWSNPVSVAMPAPMTSIGRMYYDASSDTMYLTGWSARYPPYGSEDWKIAGRMMARYDHWSTAKQLRWLRPFTTTGRPLAGDPASYQAPASFTEAGRYIFTVDLAPSPSNETPAVRVYDAETGSLVFTTYAGPEVYRRTGLVDVTNGISVAHRKNADYYVFYEDSGGGKIIILHLDLPSG